MAEPGNGTANASRRPLEFSESPPEDEVKEVGDFGEGELIPFEEKMDWLKYRINSSLTWLDTCNSVVENNLKRALVLIDQIERIWEDDIK